MGPGDPPEGLARSHCSLDVGLCPMGIHVLKPVFDPCVECCYSTNASNSFGVLKYHFLFPVGRRADTTMSVGLNVEMHVVEGSKLDEQLRLDVLAKLLGR